ncbi:putative transporter YdeK [Couchioplanes caeruleus subsp. azureus]|nr:putative transporter YdeK [Couchioplanes caeruleus subsp. azureus]
MAVINRYVAMCVTTSAILGGSFTVSREILSYPPLSGQALRYGVAALALFAVVAAGRTRVRPTARDFVRLAAVAATGLVGFNLLLLFALRHADPAVVGTIVGGSPLLLALIGPLQEGRRPALRLVAAAGTVVAGAALVQGGGSADASGIVGALGLLVAEASFSLFAAPLLPRLGAVRVSAWSTALAVPMLVLGMAATGEVPRTPTAAEAGGLLFLGLVLTVLAFVAWYTGVNGLGIERAGVFVGLVPVFALLTLAAVDGVVPRPLQVAGVLVVTGGLVAGLRVRPSPRRLAPA